uniref:Membrane transporter n=1 Tax=Pristionchus pacificus TaxID=54126 RepID=A0A2A6BMQ2_PRIPA|eukprot:PDM67180.1 membrane transporter [Pristionchus pacificus]
MVSNKERGFPVLFHSTRFVVLCLTTAALTFCLANPLILNFTVICMEDIVPEGYEDGRNATGAVHWLHDSTLRNLLFSGSAIGNFIGTFPITALIQRFGTRIAQGFAMAFTMSAAGSVCLTWAPVKEFGLYMSILSMHFQFCAIFTMPVAGAFCAGLTFALFALFFFFYEDEPAMHRKVSSKELSRIERGKENEAKGGSVPYLAICTSPAVLGVWLSSIGGNLGFQIFLQFGPIYLNKVLNFAVASTGFATALPYILSATLKAFTGPLSDHSTCLSEKARIILFASISQGFMAVCYIVMASTTNPLISQVCYTAAIVFSGLNVIGVVRCAQLVSDDRMVMAVARQFMPFVMSVLNGILCVITLVLPPFVATVASSNTPEQWSLIFYSAAAVIVVTNIVFLFVASDQAAPWTRSDYQKNKVLDGVKTVA